MRIILMRHGKPDIRSHNAVTAENFKDWVYAYNQAGLCEKNNPSPEIVTIASDCKIVVCSNLLRSTESAKRLGIDEIFRIDENFREMDMPYSSFLSFKLSPNIWSVIFRTIWFFGFSKNGESFSEAKARAIYVATELEEIAKEHDSVLFVGHVFLNKYIAKQLILNGWRCSKNLSDRYWSHSIFEL